MPRRDAHDLLGVLAGVGVTYASARLNGRDPSPFELMGGGLSGALGARLPDTFEPAIHPHHRQFAHSVTFASATGATVGRAGLRIQEKLAQAAQVADEPWKGALLSFLAGLSAGATPGYISHLVADATTPKGIPLLGKLGD